MMNNNSEFRYTGSDNLAPTLACSLYVDNSEINSTTAINGQETTIPVSDSPEGTHKWNVTCTDLVGLSNTSETRTFTLDKTPPLINVTSPSSASVNKAGIPVVVEVTDNYGVNTVQYSYQGATYDVGASFSVNTENGTDGINTILITASDLAGNTAILEYNFTIDRAPPSMQLISPDENATVDLHVPYTFIATDNYDPLLDCEIYADNNLIANGTAQNGNQTTIIGITEPGNRTFYIKCADDAENEASSESRTINVQDLSGPDIAISDIGTIVRGNTASIEATITDYSGIDSASATITDSEGNTFNLALSKNGNVYSADYQTSAQSPVGTYTVEITASDNIANSNSEQSQFEVIYSYLLTMNLPNEAYIEESVTVTGNAVLDNGSLTGQAEISLVLPSGTVSVPLDASGAFSHRFGASSNPGRYYVTASIISQYNITYNITKAFTVNNKKKSSGSGSSGGSGGGSSVIMPGTQEAGILENPEEETEPEEIIVNVPNENAQNENSGILEKQTTDTDFGRTNESEQVGVGRATSFFSALGKINWTGLLWIVLLILSIAAMLKLIGGRKKTNRFSSEMDNYMRKIRAR